MCSSIVSELKVVRRYDSCKNSILSQPSWRYLGNSNFWNVGNLKNQSWGCEILVSCGVLLTWIVVLKFWQELVVVIRYDSCKNYILSHQPTQLQIFINFPKPNFVRIWKFLKNLSINTSSGRWELSELEVRDIHLGCNQLLDSCKLELQLYSLCLKILSRYLPK